MHDEGRLQGLGLALALLLLVAAAADAATRGIEVELRASERGIGVTGHWGQVSQSNIRAA